MQLNHEMKVLLINGSPNRKGCTYTALSEIAKQLEKHNIGSEVFQTGTKAISGCIACGKCYTTKKCAIKDIVHEAQEKLAQFDAIIVGSPVHYAAASGHISSFMDRLFYSAGSQMKGKPGASVVSCRRGGAASAFDQLNKYFLINNMPLIPSQYWNQVHGSTPEDVLKDEEGLQTMRTLADNTAWLLKCIELGKQNGISHPEYEPIIRTNFIR